MVALFILFAALALYPYVIFPIVLKLFGGSAPDASSSDAFPQVSVIVSVYNEEAVVVRRVRNLLASDYPPDRLEVIVSSDGSTDRTNELVRELDEPRVRLAAFPERRGKTACLNDVVRDAPGDIVVFTDANSFFEPSTIAALVRQFEDETVGLVTGWTAYRDPRHPGDKPVAGFYAILERELKRRESNISSCVGADGAVFAVRRELYQPLDSGDINDFVIPLNVIRQGRRVVLEPDAICIEEATPAGGEFRRQIRITTRTLRALLHNIEFLNPIRYRSFSFFLLSHKVLRFLVPFFLLGALITNLGLLSSTVFVATFIVQAAGLVFTVAALAGLIGGRYANFCKMFFLTMVAQGFGWVRVLAGASDTVWTPRRS